MMHRAETLLAADEDAAQELLFNRPTSDGLPVIVPTAERVERMLAYSGGLEPDFIIGDLPPLDGRLTVEKVAINAVMAGCTPEAFPLVIAAAKILVDPAFDIGLITVTQHCVTPFLVINGPMREDAKVACGIGALGSGFRANATIGRAVRLMMANVGGSIPGVSDMSVLGSPAKFSFCVGENEEQSPWEPLHVSRGFDKDQSVVTALGVEGMHQICVGPLKAGESDMILRIAGAALASPGANNIYAGMGMVGLILSPIHAQWLADDGFTRRKVQERLYECAVQRRGTLKTVSSLTPPGDDDDLLHVVPSPDEILVLVAGADASGYSAVLPTVGNGNGQYAVSKAVEMDEACGFFRSVRETA